MRRWEWMIWAWSALGFLVAAAPRWLSPSWVSSLAVAWLMVWGALVMAEPRLTVTRLDSTDPSVPDRLLIQAVADDAPDGIARIKVMVDDRTAFEDTFTDLNMVEGLGVLADVAKGPHTVVLMVTDQQGGVQTLVVTVPAR